MCPKRSKIGNLSIILCSKSGLAMLNPLKTTHRSWETEPVEEIYKNGSQGPEAGEKMNRLPNTALNIS